MVTRNRVNLRGCILFLALTLSGTLLFSGRNFTLNFRCSPATIEKVLQSQLLTDQSDKIVFPNTTQFECLKVNKSAAGISKIFIKDNFINHECNDVMKRFLHKNKTYERTALASIPGSGNTWVRHLLEEVTGIYTGSVYIDALMKNTSNVQIKTDGVIVVKTHQPVSRPKLGFFKRAVLVIRDPFDCRLAEFNRKRTSSKTEILSEKGFSYESFNKTLNRSVTHWKTFYKNWMTSFQGPVFVLFYDKLMSDLQNSMVKLCMFLEIPVNVEDIWCMTLKREGSYHRSPKPEYMARSKLVNDEIEKQIHIAKSELIELCTKVENIKSNL